MTCRATICRPTKCERLRGVNVYDAPHATTRDARAVADGPMCAGGWQAGSVSAAADMKGLR